MKFKEFLAQKELTIMHEVITGLSEDIQQLNNKIQDMVKNGEFK